MATRYASFRSDTMACLREPGRNDNRDWVKRNKARYEEDMLEVAMAFIRSMQAVRGQGLLPGRDGK
jgi:hypothetical protein